MRGSFSTARDVIAPNSKLPAHLVRPRPQQFGLSAHFDAGEYLAAIERRKTLHERIINVAAYVLAFCIVLCGRNWLFGKSEPQVDSSVGSTLLGLAGPAWFAFLGCMPIKVWFDYLYKEHVGDLMEPPVRSYFNAVVAYDDAVRDWNERQTETGTTYWKEKRGVAFEEAVKALLVRRGCSVQTTKGSGDGGIDLIVTFGKSTFWCQCKGHASPIGVAVIREIAGVCSRGGGVPAVIAVNGYTSAAVDTAKQLSVLLIDAHNLVHMAKQQRISQWN